MDTSQSSSSSDSQGKTCSYHFLTGNYVGSVNALLLGVIFVLLAKVGTVDHSRLNQPPNHASWSLVHIKMINTLIEHSSIYNSQECTNILHVTVYSILIINELLVNQSHFFSISPSHFV